MHEVISASAAASQAQPAKKTALVQERKYKCAYCSRAFSRSEHRSRHERSRKDQRMERVFFDVAC